MSTYDEVERKFLPLEDEAPAGVGHKVVVPIGIAVGTSVLDSPTMGETWTASTSILLASGVLGNVIFCFFCARSPFGWSPTLFNTLIGIFGASLVGMQRPLVVVLLVALFRLVE